MRETKEFNAFGKKYRSKQYAAIPALHIMEKRAELDPYDILSGTEVFADDWVRLDNREAINEHVLDVTGFLPPRAILRGIMDIASQMNFGFLHTWKGTKVPKRFCGDGTTVSSDYVDPLIVHIVNEKVATYRELEEYYSLHDAFKMFDIIVVKGVNQALANEASAKEAKKKK